jgi:sugar phosphate permease
MKGRIFYGWWVILAVVIALTISTGTGFYCFGVFMEPVREDFGWTKAQVTWIITVYWIVTGLSAPWLGKLIDLYGARKIMFFSAVLNGGCLLALGFVRTLGQFYLAYGFKAIAHAGIGMVAIGSLVSRWFDKKRGRATGLATTGIGFGGLFLAPFAGYLIPRHGWRAVYVILGILLWALVIPAIALIIRSSPEDKGLLPYGYAKQDNPPDKHLKEDGTKLVKPDPDPPGLTLGQALRTPTYWLLAMCFIFVPAGVFGTLAHQTSYIESIGISREAASLALGFTAGMGILGKVFFGFLAELTKVRYAAMICFGAQALGVLILMATNSIAMVWAFVLLYGFAMGGLASLQPLIIINFFGTAAIGAILGSISFIFAIGAASGPLYAAYIYDCFQSYHWAFLIYVGAYLCAVLCIGVAPVIKKSVTVTR